MTTELKADCSRCAALCCLHLAFDEGPKFAFSKAAGQPCPHLAGHGCAIHEDLTKRGFSGCVQYDCAGAGQIVVQQIFGGASWQDDPQIAAPMAAAFRLLRDVQELRQQVLAARKLARTPQTLALCDRLEQQLTPDWSAATLASFDIGPARGLYQALIRALREEMAPGKAG